MKSDGTCLPLTDLFHSAWGPLGPSAVADDSSILNHTRRSPAPSKTGPHSGHPAPCLPHACAPALHRPPLRPNLSCFVAMSPECLFFHACFLRTGAEPTLLWNWKLSLATVDSSAMNNVTAVPEPSFTRVCFFRNKL